MVVFYGISTNVGYLMPNPFIWFVNNFSVIFLNGLEFICLHTVKLFQVSLTLIVLFAHSEMFQSLLSDTNNSI